MMLRFTLAATLLVVVVVGGVVIAAINVIADEEWPEW